MDLFSALLRMIMKVTNAGSGIQLEDAYSAGKGGAGERAEPVLATYGIPSAVTT